MNENIGGDVRNYQGQHHGSTNGVGCSDEGFGEGHGNEVIVNYPFNRAHSTFRVFAVEGCDPGLFGL